MLEAFLSLAVIVLIGNSLGRLFPGWNIDEFRKSITRIVLFFLLPALIFDVIYHCNLEGVLFEVPACAIAGIVGGLILGLAAFHWMPLDRRAKGALILACSFANVLYLGLPLLQGVFRDPTIHIEKVAILSQVTHVPLSLTFGALLAMCYSDQRGGTLRASLKEIARFPPLWALAAALICKYLEVPVPGFVLRTAEVLGESVPGLMVLSLGMAIRIERIDRLSPLLVVSGIKLVVCPVIVFLVAGLLAMKEPYHEAVTLEGGMPSQLLAIAIADRYNLDSQILARAIVVTTLLSFATIPLVRWMLF